MSLAASTMSPEKELIATLSQAVDAVEALFADARRAVAERVVREGRAVARALDREQRAAHGLAWFATYVEAIRQLAAYVAAACGRPGISARSKSFWCASAPANIWRRSSAAFR